MNITDEKLYELCKLYGERARLWRQKFAGLLPEVAKRRLYEKKGFGSIFEFAAKLAGMSEEHVRRVLNLEKKFKAMPILHAMLVNGEVSSNKLVKIASVVTPENQEILACQVKLLPCRALETLARDEKAIHKIDSQNASPKTFFDGKTVHVNTHLQQNHQSATAALNLSPMVLQKLFELQAKGVDINTLLLEFLEKRTTEIAHEKEKIAAETNKQEAIASLAELYGVPIDIAANTSRYIPVKTREIIKKEFGTKCSIPTCARDAEEIHHTQRFSLSKSHNPFFLAPLCADHHKIAHSMDVKFGEVRASIIADHGG